MSTQSSFSLQLNMSELQKQIEKDILVKIYLRNWSSESKDIIGKWKNWNDPNFEIKEWKGVKINDQTGLIAELDLSGRELKGIYLSMKFLVESRVMINLVIMLSYYVLSNTYLNKYAEIPKSIDQLIELKILDLSNNCLTGTSQLMKEFSRL